MTDCTADISRDCGPTSEGSFVCSSCARVLRNDLRQLPGLAFELEVTLTRQRGTDYAGQTGGHGGEKPLPLHAGAYASRDALKNTLATWARVLVEQGTRYGGYDDSPSIARWLSLYLDDALRSEWAPEMADEIHAITGEAQRCVDRAAEKMYLGPCNGAALVGNDGTLSNVIDGDICGGDIHANPGQPHGRCDDCGATYDVAERNAWVLDINRDRLVTVNEAAGLLKLEESVIKGWVRRKRVFARGSRRERHQFREYDAAVYRLDELIDLYRTRQTDQTRLCSA